MEITDCSVSAASNTAAFLRLGLKYGGAEAIGNTGGADQNLVAGSVGLYDDEGALVSSLAGLGADQLGQVIFNWQSGDELTIDYPGNTVLTLKADISGYTSLLEGSTISFALGSSTTNFTTSYIVAKGVSSGETLGDADILDSDSATSTLASEAMYLYAAKPTVALNSSSPSGAQIGGANKEVMRFDVTAADTDQDVRINAIRFSLGTYAGASTTVFEREYKLYKSTDPNTVLGAGMSTAIATETDSTGWVVIYPSAATQIGSGNTVTYVLKADTSAMDTVAASNQSLIISIEDGDLYWDDGLAVNARVKVLNLPVEGDTLIF